MSLRLVNLPAILFAATFLVLWLSIRVGAFFLNRKQKPDEADHADMSLILGAMLTLLGLIVGFTFSMALGRYDQRKNYEADEANAIGTEYFRAGLLPSPADVQKVRTLLATYTDRRISFYEAREKQQLLRINSDTTQLQAALWLAVLGPASTSPTPITALVVSGMNDVLNSQGYTQAAWLNRIPIAAWVLMGTIAICCNLLIGYSIPRTRWGSVATTVLILSVSLSFYFIADLDSPNGGVIRVHPQNLISLSQSFHPRQ